MLNLPLTLNLQSVHLTDEQFYQLCISNPELRVERNADGGLIIMPPVGGNSGNRELKLATDLAIWHRQTQLGKVFKLFSNF